jgi:hypothetical protein
VLVDLSDRQRGLLAIYQIWRDLFLDMSLASVVFCGGAGGRGEVGALERGCWSGGGGSIVIPRLHRWNAVVLDRRKHGDVPRSMCHSDMCLDACSGSVHRLTKPRWRWCFFWIWEWRMLNVSSNVRLGGVGVWRRPLVSASAEKPKNSSIFFYSLGFFLQSVHDNYFLLICLCFLAFTFVYSCKLIFI